MIDRVRDMNRNMNRNSQIDLNIIIHESNLRYWHNHPDDLWIKTVFKNLWHELTHKNIIITPDEVDQKLTYLKNKSKPILFNELINNKSVIINIINNSYFDHLQIIIKYNDKICNNRDICQEITLGYTLSLNRNRILKDIICDFIIKKVNPEYLLIPMLIKFYDEIIIKLLVENGYSNNIISSTHRFMDIYTISKIVTFFLDNNIKMNPNQIYSNDFENNVNMVYLLISKIHDENDVMIIERLADIYLIDPTKIITSNGNSTISQLLSNKAREVNINKLSIRITKLRNAILRKYNIIKSIYEILPQPIAEELDGYYFIDFTM